MELTKRDDLRRSLNAAVAHCDWPLVVRIASQLENLSHADTRRAAVDAEAPPWFGGRVPSGRGTFLVTGAAGFIGSHLVRRLLGEGHVVVGVDDFNNYYDPVNKYENVEGFLTHERFVLYEADVRDRAALAAVFRRHAIEQVIHLAARAGVRPSIQNPQLYVTTNVLGTQNLLDLARDCKVKNFVYASSSSVYGGSEEFPFQETQRVDRPISPYAATKKANELQAACYSRLYGFPVTGLRFFTVYGPGGRPDMAIRMFIEAMDRGQPITMFGEGDFERDFTYVDDIVEGILGAARAAQGRERWDEVLNLGESDTTSVRELILLIAQALGKVKLERDPKQLSPEETRAHVERLMADGLVKRLPEQPGDVPKTYADVSRARTLAGYAPKTRIAEGIRKTVAWHRERQALTADPCRERLRAALRTYASARQRQALDADGRWPDPLWQAEDAEHLLDAACATAAIAGTDHAAAALARRVEAGTLALLAETAAALGGIPTATSGLVLRGLDGIAVQRERRRIVTLARLGGAGGGLKPTEEAEMLTLARRILVKTGTRPTALVVAAAGYGTRIADEVGGYEMKHRLFLGDEMMLLSLRNFLPYSRRLVAVVSEKNQPDVAALLERSEINKESGFAVEYAIQRQRLGDGDAHLCASEQLDDFDGVILFLFADAPTKSPETIEKMVLVKQALGESAPLVIPCYEEDRPYSPIVLSLAGPDHGRVLWNWQKADEEDYPAAADARSGRALRNVGIFAAEASVFLALRHFRDDLFPQTGRYKAWQAKHKAWIAAGQPSDGKPKEPEFGFADLMKVLPGDGIEVAAVCLARPSDRLNVNKPADAEAVKQLYRDRHPFCRPMIESRLAQREVVIRFYDLDADKAVVRVNGRPSVRNYTRLVFPRVSNLDEASVREAVATHIRTLAQRIERELGLTVLPAEQGVIE